MYSKRLLVAGMLLVLAATAAYAQQPLDAAKCALCHREQAHFQPQTPMARAIELPPDQDALKAHPKLTFEQAGYSYTIERKGDESTYVVSDGKDSLIVPIRYGFGAHSQTFVLEHQGHFYESLVSYYSSLSALAITMGDERIRPHNLVEAMGRELPNSETVACFGCHSTNTVVEGKLKLEALIPGIQCEHCHSGASAHFEAITHGKTEPVPKKLSQLSSEDLSVFCGTCHRSWETVIRARLWGEVNVRFQPYRLASSKCFNGADKRIACTACHDPHQDLIRSDSAYDAKCTACHSPTAVHASTATPAPKICKVAQSNCVSCHMPKVELPGSHLAFTDHNIRVVRANEHYPD